MGQLINRRQRVLTKEDIRKIADTYHKWQKEDGSHQDIKGFCKSATIEEVRALDYVLTPGRYVGLPDEDDDFDFEERFLKLKAEFLEQLKEEKRLNKVILKNLEKINIKIDD
jgi:type I restriction enzyme M protein